MAAVSVPRQLVIPDFQQCNRAEGKEYLSWVKHFVLENKDKCIKLKNPPGSTLRVAGLAKTIYSGKDEEVNGWGEFYLPEIVTMEVVGVVDGASCPRDQLVLMTCENKNVYAYDGEELHLVASSLKELYDKGIKYPASKTYYNGEAFKDMTEEDWAEVKKGKVGQMLDKQHQELVKSKFNKYVKAAGHKDVGVRSKQSVLQTSRLTNA